MKKVQYYRHIQSLNQGVYVENSMKAELNLEVNSLSKNRNFIFYLELDDNFFSIYAEEVDVTFMNPQEDFLMVDMNSINSLCQQNSFNKHQRTNVQEFYENFKNENVKLIEIPTVEMMKNSNNKTKFKL